MLRDLIFCTPSHKNVVALIPISSQQSKAQVTKKSDPKNSDGFILGNAAGYQPKGLLQLNKLVSKVKRASKNEEIRT